MSAPTSASSERQTVNGGAGIDVVVRRAQQGDVSAFGTLYRQHAPAVYAVCRRMVADDREARDLVQDVFVRAWEALPGFRGQSALATWLHRLAVNVVLEHLRRERRDASRLIDTLAADDDSTDSTEARQDDHTRPDARMDLDAALDRLPHGPRTVFLLHDVEGYSHEEIAEMTGMAAATARVQLWRARRTLMRLLDR